MARVAHRLALAWGALCSIWVASLLGGCGTDHAPAAPGLSSAPQGKVDLAGLEPGVILITARTNAAQVSSDAPNGRVEPASEGAADAIRSFLDTPSLGNPYLEAGVGAVQFAFAPVAAAYGAISASHKQLTPDELARAQLELGRALRTNAAPRSLVGKVGEIGRQKTRHLLVCADGSTNARPTAMPVSAVLEVAVTRFELKLTKPGADQYFLVISASARLSRASDHRVLLERSYHYQSGSSLYVDWTRRGGLEDVAQTGYQVLAGQIAQDVFEPVLQPPILIGPGVKSSRRILHPARNRRRRFVRRGLQNSTNQAGSSVQSVGRPREETGAMEVHTGKTDERLLWPAPAAQSGGDSGQMSDTKWALDGLEEDRNAVVQGLSCLAAVPLGLWEQTVGLFGTRAQEKIEGYSKAINAATTQQHFEGNLADEVTRCLQSKAADPIERTEAPMRFALSTQPDSGQASAASMQDPAHSKTALEIQVLSTRLVGKHRYGTSRAVVVEIRATVFRTSDGQELYSRPILYRSSERRLKDWAASDASLFRRELDACSKRAAQVLVKDLLSRGMVTPRQQTN